MTCATCGGSGQMLALLKANAIYEFSFACPGCGLGRNLPPWTTEAEKLYTPVTMSMENIRRASDLRAAAFAKLRVVDLAAMKDDEPD